MQVETTIHTIRHGHTRYNTEKRYAGSIDVPLNDMGIRHTREAAAKLARAKFDVVVTSTRARSIETAHILVDSTVRVVESELCNERNFGVMEGLTWDEVQQLTPPVLFVKIGDDVHSINPKGGEPLEEVWERAKQFRRLLFAEYQGSNILVISHCVFMQMFHGMLRGLTFIEALTVAYPCNLELTSFRFIGDGLVDEKVVNLAGGGEVHW
jgi:broad specificity phosphatase PhoE